MNLLQLVLSVVIAVVVWPTHTAGQVTNLVLGAVLPLSETTLTSSVDTNALRVALDLGVNQVNKNILNALGYNISVVYRDSKNDEKLTLFGAIDICNTYPNVIGLVGEMYSFTTTQVALVGELYKVPVISPSATEDILSDKTVYPYFMRLVQPDSQQAITMAGLIAAYGWTKIALISTSDTYGLYGANAFRNATVAQGLTLLNDETVTIGHDGRVDCATQINAIANTGAKIIVVFALANPTAQILNEADEQMLLGPSYVWIGPDGLAGLTVNTLNSSNSLPVKSHLSNAIATAPYSGNASLVPVLANVSFYLYSMFMYDIPFVFASAIQTMVANNISFVRGAVDGPAVLAALYATDIVGVTGPIQFDQHGDRKNGVYEIVQWSTTSFAFDNLGPWAIGQANPPVRFAGGVTPSDDPLSGEVKIGFYVSVSRQSAIYATVKLAVDRVNANNTIPGVTMNLVTTTQSTSAKAIVDATTLTAQRVVGVIGPSTSDVCKPVAQMLGVLKVPQLSFAATTPYLSDKIEVPYFVRNVGPDSAQVTFFNAILGQYGWKRVGFLYTIESYGSDGYQYYQNALSQSRSDIQIVAAASFASDAVSLASELQVFKDAGVRIVLTMVATNLCTFMLSQIVENKLIDGYVWIHSDACGQTNKVTDPDFFNANPQVANSMAGMLAIVPYKGEGDEYRKLLSDITASNVTYDRYNASTYQQLETNPYTIYAYESVWIFANALREMVLNHQDYRDGPGLLQQLYKTNYTGLSGRTQFDSKGDRLAPYSLLNWRNSTDTGYTVIGYWNPAEQTTIRMSDGYTKNDVVWLGGATSIPKDRFDHSKSRSTLAIVLSVVLVALGIGVIILLVLLYISRKHRRHILEKILAEPWDDTEYARESYDLLASIAGVTVNKTKLDFGLPHTYRFPVDTKLTDYILLTNNNGTTQYSFYIPENEHRFSCKIHPGTGTIKNGETIQITVEFKLLCTTDVDRLIKLKLVEGGKTQYLYFQISFEGEMSDMLDPDELDIKEPLGSGGFGTVFKGNYRGTAVAIKTMNNQLLAADIAEFNKELGIMRKLKHNNVVTFVAASQIPHKRCLVTEYCKYGSLKKFMSEHKDIPFHFKLRLALDVAHAIHFLHQNGVWHRDIKPDNVLIVSKNVDSVTVAKLTDFGTSRSVTAMHQSQMYNHTAGLGTPIYMAPEILERQPYNNKIDVYSYGVLLWELLTMQTPYYFIEMNWDIYNYVVSGRRNPIPADTHPSFAALISSCWARSPANRPSFQAIISLLEHMMQDDPIFKRVPSVKEIASEGSSSSNFNSTNSNTTNSNTTNSNTTNSNTNSNNNSTTNSNNNNSVTIDITSSPFFNSPISTDNPNKDTRTTAQTDNATLKQRNTSAPPSVNRKVSETFADLLEVTGIKTTAKRGKDKKKSKLKASDNQLLASVESEK